MKHAGKMTCLAALAISALGATARADVDDSYPWQYAGGTFTGMAVMSRAYSGYFGTGGPTISSSTDVDYYVLTCGTAVHPSTGVTSPGIISSAAITFTHSKGDLDIALYTVDGKLLGSSAGIQDRETIGIASASRSVAVLKVYGYQGATNDYAIELICK